MKWEGDVGPSAPPPPPPDPHDRPPPIVPGSSSALSIEPRRTPKDPFPLIHRQGPKKVGFRCFKYLVWPVVLAAIGVFVVYAGVRGIMEDLTSEDFEGKAYCGLVIALGGVWVIIVVLLFKYIWKGQDREVARLVRHVLAGVAIFALGLTSLILLHTKNWGSKAWISWIVSGLLVFIVGLILFIRHMLEACEECGMECEAMCCCC